MEQTKKCRACQTHKDASAFSLKHKGGSRLQSNCRECCVARKKATSNKHRAIVGRWKMMKGCQSCGFKAEHYCQLDLDHVVQGTKHKSLRHHSYEPSWSMPRIKAELAKCQVLCKNCHAEKTIESKEHLVA